MVHNGIEYGDMQLIAEAYDILKRGLGLSESQIADVFSKVSLPPLFFFGKWLPKSLPLVGS